MFWVGIVTEGLYRVIKFNKSCLKYPVLNKVVVNMQKPLNLYQKDCSKYDCMNLSKDEECIKK